MHYVANEVIFKEVVFNLRVNNVQENFIFTDTQGYPNFWVAHPTLNPENNIANYKLVEQKT